MLVGTSWHCLGLLGNIGHQWGQWVAGGSCGGNGQQWAPVDNSGHLLVPPICAYCATYSCQTLNMLNPQLVTGEHGLFRDHESEDIPTIFFNFKNSVNFRVSACSKISSTLLYITEDTIGGLSCDITEKNFICYY